MTLIKRQCDVCGKEYLADTRNLKRGWGLCCGKSCAAKKRERSKVGYNPITVALNNERREHWNDNFEDESVDEWMDNDQWCDEELGIH